jgi:hypothetical protein
MEDVVATAVCHSERPIQRRSSVQTLCMSTHSLWKIRIELPRDIDSEAAGKSAAKSGHILRVLTRRLLLFVQLATPRWAAMN